MLKNKSTFDKQKHNFNFFLSIKEWDIYTYFYP